MAAGIEPMRIVIHPRDEAAEPIRRGGQRRGGKVRRRLEPADRDHRRQVPNRSSGRRRRNRPRGRHLGVGGPGPPLGWTSSGCIADLDDPDDGIGAVKLRQMIVEMSRIRREHGILLSRISLAGLDIGERWLVPRILRRVAEAMDEVIGEPVRGTVIHGPRSPCHPVRRLSFRRSQRRCIGCVAGYPALAFVAQVTCGPHSPIGRGSGLKIRTVWVRVPVGAPSKVQVKAIFAGDVSSSVRLIAASARRVAG